MLITLIATVALGLGAAGLVLGAGRLLGARPPRWVAPVVGGLAMFAFTLWVEYSWFERARAGLPEGAVIAETYRHSSALQPWTLIWPRVARFAAVTAPAAAESGAEAGAGAGRRLGAVVLAARFEPTLTVAHEFDCAGGRRRATGADWVSPGAGDPLLAAACTRPITEAEP